MKIVLSPQISKLNTVASSFGEVDILTIAVSSLYILSFCYNVMTIYVQSSKIIEHNPSTFVIFERIIQRYIVGTL